MSHTPVSPGDGCRKPAPGVAWRNLGAAGYWNMPGKSPIIVSNGCLNGNDKHMFLTINGSFSSHVRLPDGSFRLIWVVYPVWIGIIYWTTTVHQGWLVVICRLRNSWKYHLVCSDRNTPSWLIKPHICWRYPMLHGLKMTETRLRNLSSWWPHCVSMNTNTELNRYKKNRFHCKIEWLVKLLQHLTFAKYLHSFVDSFVHWVIRCFPIASLRYPAKRKKTSIVHKYSQHCQK